MSFAIVEGELYKRSHTRIMLRCFLIEHGKQLLMDIHGRVYGHHAAPRALVEKAFRQGFYWLTAVAGAERIMCTSEGCQY
jgi:hypothetical protein